MTNTPTRPALRISLPDVARLAAVQRPVVSMWRTRSAKSDRPFPPAIAKELGQEYFDVDQVVEWIETTGRGNNKDARADAAAFASLDGGSPRGDETIFLGLTALLGLSALSGRQLGDLTKTEVLDLADDHDPDDRFLYREVAALSTRLVPLSHYADLLADAAYSPAAAFEQLMTERFRLHTPGHTEVALTPPARRLVATIAMALADLAGDDVPTYVDPTDGGSDLLIELAGRIEESVSLAAQTSPADDAAARLARRRLLVNDVHQVPLVDDGFGGFRLPTGALMIAQYPSPGRPAMADHEILAAIDASVLQMLDDGYGVVVAPASALTDRSEAADERAAILRSDRVRAIVRLPDGLMTTRPRQRMALWILGPPTPDGSAAGGGLASVDRWTVVADLVDITVDDAMTDALVTDLVAGLRERSTVAHNPRFTRFLTNAALAGSDGDLVPPVAARATPGAPTGTELALRAAELSRLLTARPEPFAAPMLSVKLSTAAGSRAVMTLGAAISERMVQILSGHRLDVGDIGTQTAGSTRVIGVPELTTANAATMRTIGRLTFAANYPVGQYTEPGDVVFCTAPHPAALVDETGGSVVAFPARIARVARTAPILPQVLAADITSAAPTAKSLRAWTIRQIPDDERARLDIILRDLRLHRTQLLERVNYLDELTDLVTQGVAHQRLHLDSTNAKKGR